MSSTVKRTVVLLAALAVVLTGCAIRPAPPAGFTNRPPLTPCGEIVLGYGETVPSAAVNCMDDAHTTGAELRVSSSTTEGDTIVSYFRVGPHIDGIDLFIDGTADSFGPGTWSHQRCRGDAAISEFGTCPAR